jgi:hypothetical protein
MRLLQLMTKKINKKKHTQHSLPKWINSHKRLAMLVVILLIATVAAGSYALIKANMQVESAGTYITKPKVATIRIESNAPGVSMNGSPYCDSNKLQKLTPYGCDLPHGKTETVITAPAQTVHNNKTYIFQTWDGCSESNVDKRICKVEMNGVSSKNIVASYLEKQIATQTSKPTTQVVPNKAPACVLKNPNDIARASCNFEFTDVPAKTIVQIRMYASECGKKIQGNLNLTHPAPCQKEAAGWYALDNPNETPGSTSCNIPSACKVDMEVTAIANYKRVTITSQTQMDVSVPLKAILNTRTHCRYGCAPIEGRFDEWNYTYDPSTKTFRVSAYYLFEGIE